MLATVEAEAWDGEWYVRAFDAESRPVGSHACEEGKIFVESQAWCVLGGAGAYDGRARRALDSVHERLTTPDGIVLQQPPYSRYHPELGEISSYPPGYKENAGIFCHTNPWITLAWCSARRGRARARDVPGDLPVHAGGADRDVPLRAVRLRADDRRPRRAHSGRGEELVAHRRGRLGVRERDAGPARHRAGLRRPAHRPLHPTCMEVVQRHQALPRRRLRDHCRQPDRRLRRRQLTARRRKDVPGNLVPLAAAGDRVRVEVVLQAETRTAAAVP